MTKADVTVYCILQYKIVGTKPHTDAHARERSPSPGPQNLKEKPAPKELSGKGEAFKTKLFKTIGEISANSLPLGVAVCRWELQFAVGQFAAGSCSLPLNAQLAAGTGGGEVRTYGRCPLGP